MPAARATTLRADFVRACFEVQTSPASKRRLRRIARKRARATANGAMPAAALARAASERDFPSLFTQRRCDRRPRLGPPRFAVWRDFVTQAVHFAGGTLGVGSIPSSCEAANAPSLRCAVWSLCDTEIHLLVNAVFVRP
eukprot:4026165-Prymnesium_polylepis.1